MTHVHRTAVQFSHRRSAHDKRGSLNPIKLAVCAVLLLLSSTLATACATPHSITDYVKNNHQTPEDYVVSKFEDRDIIFLGESHYVAENLIFIQDLVPRLYEAGVYNLVWEFADYEQQEKVDRLISASSYDERLASEISATWVDGWGYQEYTDVYRAAWELNNSLPEGAKKFRIIAVNLREPVEKMEPGVRTWEERNRGYGGSFYHMGNFFWAKVIDKEVIQKDEKALVYAGFGHTATRFYNDRQRPKANGISAGNLIYDYIGKERVMALNLHGTLHIEVDDSRTFETAMEALPEEMQRAGLDTAGTPIADFATKKVGYISENRKAADFTISDIADGYIYLGTPYCEMTPVSMIPNFANEFTLPILQVRLQADNPRDEPYAADEYNEMKAESSTEIMKWFGRRWMGCPE